MAQTSVEGYIVGLPNTGQTNADTVYANFRISEYAGKDPETGRTIRNVHRCVVYDQPQRNMYLASELVQRMLVENDRFDDDQFLVTGTLKPNSWTASDGTVYRDMQLRVDSMAQLINFDYANRFRPTRPAPRLSPNQIEANNRALAQAVATTLPEPNNQAAPATPARV